MNSVRSFSVKALVLAGLLSGLSAQALPTVAEVTKAGKTVAGNASNAVVGFFGKVRASLPSMPNVSMPKGVTDAAKHGFDGARTAANTVVTAAKANPVITVAAAATTVAATLAYIYRAELAKFLGFDKKK